jgi:hypothetical protein
MPVFRYTPYLSVSDLTRQAVRGTETTSASMARPSGCTDELATSRVSANTGLTSECDMTAYIVCISESRHCRHTIPLPNICDRDLVLAIRFALLIQFVQHATE